MENKQREYLYANEPQVIAELGHGAPRIVFNVATHGNEPQPLLAVEDFLQQVGNESITRGTVAFTLANPQALREGKRYLSHDLNRIYPGRMDGTGEEVLASQMLAMLGRPEFVVDLHTGPETPPVVILGRRDPQRLALAEASGIGPIVLFESDGDPCAMVDYVPCGIGIELGRHTDDASRVKGVEVIANCLGNLGFMNHEVVREENQYFEVIDSLMHQDVAHLPHELLHDFEQIDPSIFPVTKDHDVFPFLCGMRTYTPIHCFLVRKVLRDYMSHY